MKKQLIALLLTVGLANAASTQLQGESFIGEVYTLTNQPAGNSVLVFHRDFQRVIQFSKSFRDTATMTPLNAVIPLGESKAEALANALSSFSCDQLPFTCLIPDTHARRMVLRPLFDSALRACRTHGETYTTPALDGASLWIRPGRILAIQRILRTGSSQSAFRLSWSSLKASVALAIRLEEVHLRLSQHPHWRLLALAVEPSKQENALREALIRPVLLQADAEDLPCYLETFHEMSLSFYEDQGFRIEGSGHVPAHGLDFWAMIRSPRL